MVEALFGSKTRVKLLNLFLSQPEQSFYVREITRKIDEQINSVRRELSNMLEAGVITSDSADNKLYYKANKKYQHYASLSKMFGGNVEDIQDKHAAGDKSDTNDKISKYVDFIEKVPQIKIVLFSGVLTGDASSPVDVLIVGALTPSQTKTIVSRIEKEAGRELRYSVVLYDEFYYRLSVRDKFITAILDSQYKIIIDKDKALANRK